MGKAESAEWKTRREKIHSAIIDLIPEEKIVDKCVLDVGCRTGCISAMLYDLTSHINGCDVRVETIRRAKELHPELKFFVWDIEDGWPRISKVDIILYLGILYHLADPKKNLTELCSLLKRGQHVIMETEYVNSADPDKVIGLKQGGSNTSFNRIGHRPSYSMIEEIFKSHGITFHKTWTDKYNSQYYKYDSPYGDDDKMQNRWIRGIWHFYK